MVGIVRRDITGERFGRLSAVSKTGNKHKTKGHYYLCACECGGTVEAHYVSLTQKIRSSCGCLFNEARDIHNLNQKENGRTHGLSGHPLYKIHFMMIDRCTNENSRDYIRYGGRGISVCTEWSQPNGVGLSNFINDMGDRPTSDHSIDRIDNEKGYNKTNCRWATRSVQQINKKRESQPGVYKTKNGKRWRATIHRNGKLSTIGTFDTYEHALSARLLSESSITPTT